MGYGEVVVPEGDDVPQGEIPRLTLFNLNGVPLPDQGVHTISRYREGEGFPHPQLFQDQMVDELLISRIFHSCLE